MCHSLVHDYEIIHPLTHIYSAVFIRIITLWLSNNSPESLFRDTLGTKRKLCLNLNNWEIEIDRVMLLL